MLQGDYKVLLESRAEKDLNKLENDIRARVVTRLLFLRNDPRPAGSKKLEGSKSTWRIRIGDWRVVYEINDKAREVKIYRVKHRSEGY